MKQLFFILLLAVTLFSCKTIRAPIESQKSETVYIEKLVPYALPQDSATLIALLECDSNGVVLLKQLDMLTSKNANLNFALDSLGKLVANVGIKHDTIYVPKIEKSSSDTITVTQLIEKEYSAFDKLQKWWFWISIVVIAIFLFFKFRR